MKVMVLSNHISGYDALMGMNKSMVPISTILTTTPEVNDAKKISGALDFSDLGIPIQYVESYNLKSDVHRFDSFDADILLVMGYQRLVPDEILQKVRIASFGFHGSSEPLPKGRGRSPINWELIRGRKRFILHMFHLEPGADSGDVASAYAFDMNEFDTITTVYQKVSLAMRSMIEDIVPRLLRGEKIPRRQQIGEPSHFHKRTPEDGLVNWNQDSVQVYNFVRALTRPYPGAFTVCRGEKLLIWRAQPFSEFFYFDAPPGKVLEVFGAGDFLVKTQDGSLLVTDYEGPKPAAGQTLGT